MIYKCTFPELFFLSLFSMYLTLLIFLDCKMSFCVWPTQTGRGRSGCYLGLACVLLTALLFVFINANLKNKSTPLPLCPSPPLPHSFPLLCSNNKARMHIHNITAFLFPLNIFWCWTCS